MFIKDTMLTVDDLQQRWVIFENHFNDLEKLILKVKELLKNEGEFCIIIPSNRLNDLQKYIYNKNMNILVLKFFVSSKKELVIVHGKKGGKNNSSIKIEIENV